MTSIRKLGKQWKMDLVFQTEYDALEEEFALAAALIKARKALIKARKHANLTQEQLAERMKTSQASVARLEGTKGNPSLNTLRRYAEATGTRLKITFEASPGK